MGVIGLTAIAVTLIAAAGNFSVGNPAPEIQAAPQPLAKGSVSAPEDRTRSQMIEYILSKNRKVYPKQAEHIVDAVLAASGKFQVPARYLLVLIEVESSFQTDAVSDKECVGLTQINPKVWIEDEANPGNLAKKGILETTRDLYSPAKNVAAGAYILGHYIEEGRAKGKAHPVRYGVIRYCGRGSSRHYDKFKAALGEYSIFCES